MIFKLENGRDLIGDEQLQNPETPLSGEPKVTGSDDPGWEKLEGVIGELCKVIEDDPRPSTMTATDLSLLNELCDHLDVSRRDAGDRRMWHFATVLRFRRYVHARWTSGEQTTKERMLGDSRRNALASLWWIADSLDERTSLERPYCKRLFHDADARLRLWITDFQPFFGRPSLVRATIDHCISNEIRGTKDVDALFKSIGAVAAVRELDLFVNDPNRLILDATEISSMLAEIPG